MTVQGQLLEITVIECRHLKDTEWFSRQDPYVILDYAGNKYRTKTDTDGGRNPNFNEKYMLPLIEGLREINVAVWNSNTLSADDFLGSGKILLQKVLTDGYHDSAWPLTTRSGRRAGDIRVFLHYSGTKGAQHVSSHIHQSLPMYPPSSPAHYPQSAYAAPPRYSDCFGYQGQTAHPTHCAGACQASGAFGTQSPYHPQSYPPPTYPPSYPPPTYPPQGSSGYGAPPAGYYYPPY
ncbi:hypothetical protein L7F22_067647 [Adiantum nelumboides]|nr:hypothetical protein [Adiantum nelumboides]